MGGSVSRASSDPGAAHPVYGRAGFSVNARSIAVGRALPGDPGRQIGRALPLRRMEIDHSFENNLRLLPPKGVYFLFKRFIDWIIAALLAIVLLPVFAALALLIKIDSPGPVLFRQVRTGLRGKPIVLYKFRTMRHEPAPRDNPELAITRAGDSRITHVGRLLRRLRLDELPQIINILRGEMSWVGPRPEAIVLADWYENEIPLYRLRHVVRPGITGWAQINQGHVADVDAVKTKLQHDFFYIRNLSPRLDLLILARTIPIILSGFGAI